jgi:hypothetical protein
MLERACMEEGWLLPADIASYVLWDDGFLKACLERSSNPWAQAVAQRKPYRLLVETHTYGGEGAVHKMLCDALEQAHVDFFCTHSKGVLSEYASAVHKGVGLKIVQPEVGQATDVNTYTPLYSRFASVAGVERVFCKPEHFAKAQKIFKGHGGLQKG